VGPVCVLCIRRTLAGGRACGLASGLGAATADALYGLVAGLGLAFVADFLVGGQGWLRLAGGLFLIYLGAKTFRAAPPAPDAQAKSNARDLASAYASTFALTVTNPLTILSFGVMFAGLGAAGRADGYASALLLVAGVFLGSAAWWLALSLAVGALRSKFDSRRMRWVNRAAGLVLAAFGACVLMQ
ncbi:MAG TPA: LysE family transporter, partial [Pyrinomonadaceae bacterium]|nr:LysE family transporter [Pyrinomonadaceae bacterium]